MNRHRTAFALTLVQAINGIGNAGQQLFHRQKLPNHTGRAHKNLLRLNPQQLRCMGLHPASISQALLARASISAAAIHNNRLRITMLVHLTAHKHRSRTHFILGKNSATGSGSSAINHRHIMIAAHLNAGLHTRSNKPLRSSYPPFNFLHFYPSFILRIIAIIN